MQRTTCTKCLVWTCILIINIMLVASCYFTQKLLANTIANSPDCQGDNAISPNSWPQVTDPKTCATETMQFYFVLLIIACLVCICFFLLCILKKSAIDLAIKVVGAAAAALQDLAGLMFLPLVTVFYKLIIVFIFL